MTSTQAVGKVRWLFGAKKAGHAGTLDPLATGILPRWGALALAGLTLFMFAEAFLPRVAQALGERGVELRADTNAQPLLPGSTAATDEDYATPAQGLGKLDGVPGRGRELTAEIQWRW